MVSEKTRVLVISPRVRSVWKIDVMPHPPALIPLLSAKNEKDGGTSALHGASSLRRTSSQGKCNRECG